MLALLTKNRALDKVQAAGEGLGAWRCLQEQWEPKSRSRFTSILLGILNGRFKGDAQNDIESWERDIRSFEKQTSFAIPDFVKAGLLINGLQEEPLRRHMVLHTSKLDTYEKLRVEVTEIARVKVMSVNPVPMDVDALRFKGKGKGKTKDHKEKGKANKERGIHSKSADPKMWSVTTEARRVTRSPTACSARQISRRRSLRVVLRCLLKLSTRFMKSATLPLQLGTRCALPAGPRASR